NHRWRQLCDARSEASDVNGSDLLCLGFGRACQPGGTGCSVVWKGSTCVTLDVTGTTVTTPRPRIVARSFAPSLLTIYNGPPPIGLRAAYRLKVGKANLALYHEHGARQRRSAPIRPPHLISPPPARPPRTRLQAGIRATTRSLAGRRPNVTRCCRAMVVAVAASV